MARVHFDRVSRGTIHSLVAENAAQLEVLGDSWRHLLDQCIDPPMFMRPEWICTWWRHYSGNRNLSVIFYFDGPEIVGIAPMCRRTHSYGPGLSFTRCELASAGSSDPDGVHGEYLGVLALPGREVDVAMAFTADLSESLPGQWDECVLDLMRSGDAMTAELEAALSRAFGTVETSPVDHAMYLPLPADWNTYLAQLTKKRRGWVRRTFGDFEAWAGTDGYAFERATDSASLSRGLDILSRLHGERWQHEGQTGAFGSNRFRDFHNDLAAQLLPRGEVDLMWLTVRGEPIAAHYSFIVDDTVYFYQCGRKMDLPQRIGVGNVMILQSIKDAIARGNSEYDFLGGSVGYKSMFASQSRQLIRMRVARPSLREQTYRTLRSVSRVARRFSSPKQLPASPQ